MPIRPISLALLLAFAAAVRAEPAPAQPPLPLPADGLQSASAEVRQVARWVVDSGDNMGMPFLLVDKVNAQVFAFSPSGQVQGMTPALLGLAHGDRLLASNDAKVEAVAPQQRITPAGRYISKLAIDSHGQELLVIDYQASISLHPVVKGTPEERRAERLNSATSEDNRISYGCINVPPAFYSTIVSPAFRHGKGVVYILPETSPAAQLFGFQRGDAATPALHSGSTGADAQPARALHAASAK